MNALTVRQYQEGLISDEDFEMVWFESVKEKQGVEYFVQLYLEGVLEYCIPDLVRGGRIVFRTEQFLE